MKWTDWIFFTILMAFISLYEMKRLNKNPKKDKYFLLFFNAIVWGLSILLVLFPGMPGPNRWVGTILSPFSKWMEK